jgi:2-keto-3-deoxy-L-rhamnonate aldolase RhmA
VRLAQTIKDRLRGGGVSVGSWASIGHPSTAEILALAGYDWVVVDTEHTAIDNSEALRMITAIERGGAIPLVRLAWNDPIQSKVVLDSGAAGVIVPMVNTKSDAELAVRGAKYPPLGIRGAGLARAHDYGPGFAEYVKHANAATLLIVQIESIDGVANIESILDVPGLDGTFIGPYDLSMSMGLAGQLDHPDVVAAQKRVVAATRARGLAAGIHLVHPDRAALDLPACIDAGYQFIALSSDLLFLGDSARELARRARALIDGR